MLIIISLPRPFTVGRARGSPALYVSIPLFALISLYCKYLFVELFPLPRLLLIESRAISHSFLFVLVVFDSVSVHRKC